MRIEIASLLGGARHAEGTVVIIDVFRAFTTAAVAFSRGAEKIVLVAEVEEALALRARGVGDMCMGEVAGVRPEEFDFGNSPFELSTAEVSGKTLIQSTRAGTVGVSAATRADRIYAASLVIARATADAIRRHAPDLVTIVAMGGEGTVRTDEDEQCALYLRNLLQGRQPDRDSVRNLVRAGGESPKIRRPRAPSLSRAGPGDSAEDRLLSLRHQGGPGGRASGRQARGRLSCQDLPPGPRRVPPRERGGIVARLRRYHTLEDVADIRSAIASRLRAVMIVIDRVLAPQYNALGAIW